MYKLYIPEHNPNNVTGQVGGAISETLVSGYVDEVFPHVAAPPSGQTDPFIQYRKVFIKNEYESDSSNTRIWVEGAEHLDQIEVGLGTSSDVIVNGTTAPSVSLWRSPTSYSNGLEIGALSKNSSVGVWLKQSLSGVINPDPYVSFRLYVGGKLEQ